MGWVASTLYTTSELGVSTITTADAHTSAASNRLNWRPCRFKWTSPFRRKTKSGFCTCAITFQTQSTQRSSHLSVFLPSVEVLSDALPSILALCNTYTTSTCSPQSRSRVFKRSRNPLDRLSSQKWLCGWKERLHSSEALSKNIYAIFSLPFFESFYFPSQEPSLPLTPRRFLFQPQQLAQKHNESLC